MKEWALATGVAICGYETYYEWELDQHIRFYH